jgi:structural maintenance of chromosomes protein 5
MQELNARGTARVTEGRSMKQRLDGLDTQAGQQEHKLQQHSRDSYQAWKWIQEHSDEFKDKVYGPPIIECSLKDPKYANAIESLFQENDLKAFTAQSKEDFYKLQRILLREMGLQDVSLRVCSDSSMDQFRPVLSDRDLHGCGMEGWAIDYLNGPDVVLAMLCGEKRLHTTAISLRDITQEQYSFLENSNVTSWVVNGTLFQAVRRREYGAAGNSTRTRGIREARIWTNRPVDSSAKDRLGQQIHDIEVEVATLKEELEKIRGKKRDLGPEHIALGEELEALKTEKENKQREIIIFRGLPTKLTQEEQKLARIEENLTGTRGRIDDIHKDRDKTLLEKVETTLKYAEAIVQFRNTHDSLLELEIQHIEAKSDFETLKSRNEHVQATLKSKQDEEKAAVDESNRMSAKARELVVHVRELAAEARALEDAGETMWQEYLEEFGRKSEEELEADIESEKARLELTHDGNTNILKEFEDRQKRIDKLREGLAKFIYEQEGVQTAIEEVRGKWEPELDSLVSKISDAFSDSFARIGCAGQVTVFKASSSDQDDRNSNDLARSRTAGLDEDQVGQEGNGLDFANWAIHISVKFRDSEPLSLLDSHRQSGGERAVSTIFYLMALQSLSRAPFRVVDEINQGMDPRNERMVHGRMVDIACGEDGGQAGAGSQYFLITPKLLGGLKYKRGMRVLNIVSGEKMPPYGEGGNKVDFGAWVKRARELGLGKMMGGIACGAGGSGGERRVDSGMHLGSSFDGDEEVDGVDGEGVGSVRSQSRVTEVGA